MMNNLTTNDNYELGCLKLSRLVANDDVLDKGVKQRQLSSVNNERGFIPPDEWRKLSPQEKAAIQQSRPSQISRRRSTRKKIGGRGHGGIGRNDSSNRLSTGRYDNAERPGRNDDIQGQGKSRGGKRVRFNEESKTIYPHTRNINKIKSYPETANVNNDHDNDEDSFDDYEELEGMPSQKFRKVNGIRRISRIAQDVSDSDEVRVELDSHVDNGVLGSDAAVLEEYLDEVFKVYDPYESCTGL